MGAADNIRKRAEMPGSYFARLKATGVDIEKHLLLEDFAIDPSKLSFNGPTYVDFRDRRFQQIWKIAAATVNPELEGAVT